MTTLSAPAATIERLTIPDVEVTGITDPTDCTVETCLDPDAVRAKDAAPETGWEVASWLDATTVSTHLITGVAAGTYGLWLRITGVEAGHLTGERVVLFAGVVKLTAE